MNNEEQNLTKIDDTPVKTELYPPLEPALEQNDDTSVAPQEPEEVESLESPLNIESLSLDPALANGLPDVNSVPPLKEEEAPVKKKKGNKGKLTIILVLLILAIGAFIAYQFFMDNPYNIYKTIITKSFGESRGVLEKLNDFTQPISYTGTAKFESNLADLKELNNYSFNYGLGIDATNNKMELMASINENDKTLLDAFVYFLNNKMYLKSEKLYEKLLLLGDGEVDFSSLKNNYTKDDMLYLHDKLKTALLNSVRKDDFASTNATINVNGSKIKVKDNYLLITPQNVKTIVERFINSFKNDEKALDILTKFLDVSKEDLLTSFDDILATDYSNDEGVICISIYTQFLTNKVMGYNIKVDEKEIIKAGFKGNKGEININLNSGVIACDIKGNVTECKMQEAEKVIASGKLTKVDENENKIEFTMEGLAINLSLKLKEESKNITNQDIVLELIIPKSESNIKVTISNKIESNKEISAIDPNSAVDINSLSESDLKNITDKLQTILEPTSLYGLLDSIMTEYNGSATNKVNPACANANCTSCYGDTCTCQYYDNTFTLQTITCPNNTYY